MEKGFDCFGGSLVTADVCEPICGDGLRQDGDFVAYPEQCDVGTADDPGCVGCVLMAGFQCTENPVTESARAHSYFFSKEVQKTGQFWLLTVWLLTF